MSIHQIIVSIISILANFIEVEYRSSSSLFNTHFWITYSFFVVFSIYVVSLITVSVRDRVQSTRNDNDGGVLSKVSVLIGVLASIFLLLIIRPILGWVALLLWILYSLKTAYEMVDVGVFFQTLQILKNSFLQLLEKLKNAFLQLLKKLKNAVCGQTADMLPVSV